MKNAIFYPLAFLLPLLWHYAGFLKKDYNLYTILSTIGFIGTFVLFYSFFVQFFKKKIAYKSKRKRWLHELKKTSLPAILTMLVMVAWLATFGFIDRVIIKVLGEERQQVVVTKDPSISTISRVDRVVGHYFYYSHNGKKYPGEASTEDYEPGDSLLVVYSKIFPAIRIIKK